MYRLCLKKILWIIIFLTFPLSVTAGGILPVGKMEYEFLYELREHREKLSLAPDDYQLGPYRLEKFDTTLTPFEKLNNLSNKSLGLFSFISEDFRAAKDNSAKGYEAWRGGLFAQPHEKLFVYANFILDEYKAKDPDYTGKKWRGLAGDVENAFAYYRTQMFEVTVGRFASFWGPRNSLVLASGSSMDGFGYTIRWGRLSLSYRLAWLDGLNPDQDGVEQFENRYFAGHRLDINLSRKIRVGFFETVIFGGPGRNVDFYYLNPVFFYHGSQLNEGMDDNTFLGFDFTFKPRTGYKLYGQLMVDDYQIDNEEQSDQEPSEYGLLAGGYITDFLNISDLKIEYTRVANWTFNQVNERNRYVYENSPIGDVYGNDYDNIRVSFIRWLDNNRSVSLNCSYLRKGEGEITADWSSPWMLVTGEYDEKFPSGIVQKTSSLSVRFKGFIWNHFFVDLETGIDRHKNYEHVINDNRTLPFVHFKISSFILSSVDIK